MYAILLFKIYNRSKNSNINLLQTAQGEQFDFIFVDADKDNYKRYHDQVIKMVKLGGVIAYDNTLWLGSVAGEDNGSLSHGALVTRDNIVDFNTSLASDSRIEISQISIGDGVTLCRRIL